MVFTRVSIFLRGKGFYLALLAILILAGLLRAYHAGLYEMWLDEIVLHDSAIQMARHGVWAWLGNRSQYAGLEAHSPFSTYLIALPYLFSANPQTARIFVAFFGLLSILISAIMVKRYFGAKAALITATLFAVFPLLVDQGRWVWNPNLAAPFISLYLFTALLGYYEGKGRFQMIHFLCLSALIQTQAAYFSLLPLSMLAVVYSFWKLPKQRWTLLKRHVLALCLVLISFTPWAYGIYLFRTGAIQLSGVEVQEGSTGLVLGIPSLNQVWNSFASLNAGANFHLNTLAASSAHAAWWPDSSLNMLFELEAILLAGIILYFLWRCLLKDSHYYPAIFFIMLALWPLGFEFLAGTKKLSPSYMYPMTYAALPLLGIGLARLWQRHKITLFIPLLAFFLGHLWLSVAYLDWKARDPQILSLSEMQTLSETWLSESEEILVLENPGEELMYTRFEWRLYWSILGEAYPLRAVTALHSFPIAENGQMMVSPDYDTTIPELFGEGEIVDTGQRRFRYLEISPDDLPVPQFRPQQAAVYSDILEIEGLVVRPSDEDFDVFVLWTIRSLPEENLNFSIRLFDAEQQSYGQVDGLSLEAPLWRVGDRVLSRFQISRSPHTPDLENLHFEVVVYSYPEMQGYGTSSFFYNGNEGANQ